MSEYLKALGETRLNPKITVSIGNDQSVIVPLGRFLGGETSYGERVVKDFTRRKKAPQVGADNHARSHREVLRALTTLIVPETNGRSVLPRKVLRRRLEYLTEAEKRILNDNLRDVLVAHYGKLVPKKREHFLHLYEASAKSAHRLRTEVKELLSDYLDEGAKRMLETNNEAELAIDPVSQLKVALSPDPKAAYEGMSLMVATILGLPGIHRSEVVDGDAELFFNTFVNIFKRADASNQDVTPFSVIAKIDKHTGECIEWHPYNESQDPLPKRKVPWRSWYQRIESFPYRITKSGIRLSFDGTRKKDEADIVRKAIFSLKAADDIIAFRTQVDETHALDGQPVEFTEQVGIIISDVMNMFISQSHEIYISTTEKSGLTQKSPKPVRVTLNYEHPQTDSSKQIILEPTIGANEVGERKAVVQVDFYVVMGEKRFKVEWQIEPIGGCLDRKHAIRIADKIYRLKQYFRKLEKLNPNLSLINFFYPTYYAGNIRQTNFDELEPQLRQATLKQVRKNAETVVLPTRPTTLLDRVRRWL